MSQHITVVDYNPLWAKKYEEEALLIREIPCGNDGQRIGSSCTGWS